MLVNKKCTPCSDNKKALTVQEANELLKHTPNWTMLDDATLMVREFEFENFKDALDFVNEIGELAEKEGHHPDIAFGWQYCSIALQTHSLEALSENDFILAAKIDALVGD